MDYPPENEHDNGKSIIWRCISYEKTWIFQHHLSLPGGVLSVTQQDTFQNPPDLPVESAELIRRKRLKRNWRNYTVLVGPYACGTWKEMLPWAMGCLGQKDLNSTSSPLTTIDFYSFMFGFFGTGRDFCNSDSNFRFQIVGHNSPKISPGAVLKP